jgi:hypothetical protein
MRVFAFLAVMVGLLVTASASAGTSNDAFTKGSGAVSTTDTQSTPIYRSVFDILGTDYGQFPVANSVAVTTTDESFTFNAKRSSQASSVDPTAGASGSMRLSYQASTTTTVSIDPAFAGICAGGFLYVPGGCPVPSSSTSPAQTATATADVTCLNVVQNHASIGGFVTKFQGNFTPMRGMLFNATDNTIAKQQPTQDRFAGSFASDVPYTCPPPGADAPITSGDVYVQQS